MRASGSRRAGLIALATISAGPRAAHWARAMTARGRYRPIRVKATGAAERAQKAAAIMIWTGLAALVGATALASFYGLTIGAPFLR